MQLLKEGTKLHWGEEQPVSFLKLKHAITSGLSLLFHLNPNTVDCWCCTSSTTIRFHLSSYGIWKSLTHRNQNEVFPNWKRGIGHRIWMPTLSPLSIWGIRWDGNQPLPAGVHLLAQVIGKTNAGTCAKMVTQIAGVWYQSCIWVWSTKSSRCTLK